MGNNFSTVEEYLGIIIDYSRDREITEQGLALLTGKGFYRKDYETSPQQGLARASTCFSFGDYEFAQRIYDYASKGYFTFAGAPLISAIDVTWPTFTEEEFEEAGSWLENNVTPEGMPINCFAAGTPIMTNEGEKSIEQIKEGDLVLTHKGRFRKVNKTRKSTSNDIYKLKSTSKSTLMFVTGNHRMLTNKGWVEVKDLSKSKHLLATTEKVEWDTVNNIVFTINNDETEKYNSGTFTRKLVNEKVTLDEKLAWAIGLWFAEGCTNDNGTVKITHQNEQTVSEWLCIMNASFGVKGNLSHSKAGDWIDGVICNKNLQEFFDNYFGKGCYNKKLNAEMMSMNQITFEKFYDGFYTGDGFKTTKHKAFELANTVFVSQLSLLLSKYGVKHNLQLRKKTHRENSHNGIISYVEEDQRQKLGIRSGISMNDGLCYCAIDIVEPVFGNNSINVYDIEVDEDESFSVAGVIAHNCFLSHISDTREALVNTRKETAWLAMMGGGIGIYSANRSPDDKSTGVMAHLKGYDADALAYKQTKAKRGSIASYLDIDHPEILSFLSMRDPVGGDFNKKCFNLHNAVNITDNFMEAVINNEKYELVDPKHGNTGKFLEAKEVWEELLQRRFETGEPYLMFKDTVNRGIPNWITHPLYHVSQSNLCSEIVLRTSNKRTAVCCLSSLNLEKFDEWKGTTIVADLIRLLDNILEYFIRLAPKELDRARYSAIKERAIGLGTLGWHSYLQSKMIPFESGGFNSAIQHTHLIYSELRAKAIAESKRLAELRGEPDDCYGGGMRNSHLFAIAPNATSSSRVGTSPSVEPWSSNAFTAQGRAGSFLVKNKYLDKLLTEKGKNNKEVWSNILTNGGSVQHLDFLDEHEKNVFKTYEEINQLFVIEQASHRQPYICQSQSINIKVREDITLQEMSDIHMMAYFKGLKTLYYCRCDREDNAKLNKEVSKPEAVDLMSSDCIGCEA